MTAKTTDGFDEKCKLTESMINEADRLFNERNFEQAFDLYRKSAEAGDNLSKCRMGVMYYEGLGVERRPIKAFELIKESYDPNCAETVYQLGKCHFEGIGTPVNKELGFEMIISAAETGHPSAENYIAALYIEGDYVRKDIDRALSWMNKAVEHEDPKALYNMGNFLYDGRYVNMNRPRAMKLWKRSSELHYIPALGKLGSIYIEEEDPKKVDKGLRSLQRAASFGDGDAAELLADYYVSNSRGQKDIEKAIELYKIALKNGNKGALFDLGMMYNVVSEEKDHRKACEYFKEGYENGNHRCSFEYAIMKSRGIGTNKDDELAFKIFLEGAEKGDPRFMGWVGHCYHHGIGVNPDEYRAKEWFERGCEKGDAYCTFRLAEFYFRGIAVELERDYGLELLRRSFKNGEKQAAYRLGTLYENNRYVKSIPDAIYWYMTGAEKKDCECMMKLASHYESGAFIAKSEEKAFRLYQDAYKEENSPMAAAEIGRCFEEGIGTESDIKTATSWYLKAAKKNAFAMWRLYNIYIEKGEIDRAVFWLRRSAAKGSVSAMVELAKIYEDGKLVPKSDFMAMQWYHKASDEGNEFAKSRFEELIRYDPEDSDGINEYERMARIAGEGSDNMNILSIGHSLSEGIEMPMDLTKARIWYDIASQLGVYGAKDGIKKIDSMMKSEKNINGKQTTLD